MSGYLTAISNVGRTGCGNVAVVARGESCHRVVKVDSSGELVGIDKFELLSRKSVVFGELSSSFSMWFVTNPGLEQCWLKAWVTP